MPLYDCGSFKDPTGSPCVMEHDELVLGFLKNVAMIQSNVGHKDYEVCMCCALCPFGSTCQQVAQFETLGYGGNVNGTLFLV